MRDYFTTALLVVLFVSLGFAQNSQQDFEVGTVLVIEKVSDDNYKHINFPRNNVIIKQGGVPNYDKVRGQEVVITSLKEKKDGTVVATIKLTSEKFFFNSHKYLKVHIEEALAQSELRAL